MKFIPETVPVKKQTRNKQTNSKYEKNGGRKEAYAPFLLFFSYIAI